MDTLIDDALASLAQFEPLTDDADINPDPFTKTLHQFQRFLWDAPIKAARAPDLFAPLRAEESNRAAQWLIGDHCEGSDTFDLAVLRYLRDPAVSGSLSHPSFLAIAIEGGLLSSHPQVRREAAALATDLIDAGADAEALPDADWFDNTPEPEADTIAIRARIRASLGLSAEGH